MFEEKYLNPESLKHDICILIVIQNKLRLSKLSCMHIFQTFPDNLWLLQHACIIVSTKKGSCFEKCLFDGDIFLEKEIFGNMLVELMSHWPHPVLAKQTHG
jgi:hypothetical protein